MKDILKTVFDYVFSFEAVVALFCVGILLSLGGMIIKENERNDLTQARTEACYAQGMVLVQSDAGERCVAPADLVKVK
jgi:hypothetical protein